MIIKINIKTSTGSQFCFLNKVPYSLGLADEVIKEINDRAAYVMEQASSTILVGSALVTNGHVIMLKSLKFNPINTENFLETFEINLHRNFSENKELYQFDFVGTKERMKTSILDGTFNKESESFKKTCKQLNIKHTYKAINAYLMGV